MTRDDKGSHTLIGPGHHGDACLVFNRHHGLALDSGLAHTGHPGHCSHHSKHFSENISDLSLTNQLTSALPVSAREGELRDFTVK